MVLFFCHFSVAFGVVVYTETLACCFDSAPEAKDETVSIERVFISGGRRKQCLNEVWRTRDAAKRLKDDYFDVNGEHYLLKMFLSESLENAFMIRNFLHIYIYVVCRFLCILWFLFCLFMRSCILYLECIIFEFAGDAR